MTTNQLKEFFTSRPSLSKRGVCREAGISDTLLDRIMFRGGTLTDNVAAKLAPVLNRYGGCITQVREYNIEDFMEEHGLGEEDLVNDITMPWER